MAKPQNAGAERVARRSKQAVNAAQATQDSLLVPPQGDEKEAAVAQSQARQLARFGGDGKTSARKLAQARNKQTSEAEAATLSHSNPDAERILLGVAPGATPTLRQLRLLSKVNQQPMNDAAHEIARDAGRLIKDTLIGRRSATPMAVRRQRRVEQSQRQMANANATK